jgi:hypothetical protein
MPRSQRRSSKCPGLGYRIPDRERHFGADLFVVGRNEIDQLSLACAIGGGAGSLCNGASFGLDVAFA